MTAEISKNNASPDLYINAALSTPANSKAVSASDRLDSWKEIAAYLNRSVRTVRRWEEQHGLPVYRLSQKKGGPIYAYKAELDSWWDSHKLQDGSASLLDETSPRPFIASLAGRHDGSLDKRGKPLAAVSAIRSHHTQIWIILAAVAGVLAAIYGIEQSPSRDSESLIVAPLTALPGNEVQPSLSPDGNQVAFAFDGGRSANYHIYVKTLARKKLLA